MGKGPQALIRYLQTNKIWVLLLFIIVAGRVWLASYIPVMEFTEARYAEIDRKALLAGILDNTIDMILMIRMFSFNVWFILSLLLLDTYIITQSQRYTRKRRCNTEK